MRGDSLWRIAAHELGDGSRWPEIQTTNRLRRGAPLLIGQFLTLPSRYTHRQYGTSHHRNAAKSHTPPYATSHSPSPAAAHPSTSPAHPMQSPPHAHGEAFRPAVPVMFPELKYKFEHTVRTIPYVLGHLELKLTGELTMRKQGVITGGLTFTQQGIEVEYKKDYDGMMRNFFQSCNATVEDGKAELTIATGAVMMQGDQVMASTQRL